MTDTGIREILVIGSGPAGYSAALYTAAPDSSRSCSAVRSSWAAR